VTTHLAVRSWVERARAALSESVWMPVGLRVTGIAALMLGLAAVGASSVVSATRGAPAPRTSRSGPGIGVNWIASTPPSGARSVRARTPYDSSRSQSKLSAGGTNESQSAGVTEDGRVILNRASRDELTRLPGVGVKRAEAIVRLRERLKRFRRITDLLRVRGIGPKTLRRMRPQLVLDVPEPRPSSEPQPAPSAPHP
jgi:competence protein ComEA